MVSRQSSGSAQPLLASAPVSAYASTAKRVRSPAWPEQKGVTMSRAYVLPLSDPRADLAVVGGKGASLARLSRARLPVPEGFHVTTAAYRDFVAANDLQDRILAALRTADPSQPTSLET